MSLAAASTSWKSIWSFCTVLWCTCRGRTRHGLDTCRAALDCFAPRSCALSRLLSRMLMKGRLQSWCWKSRVRRCRRVILGSQCCPEFIYSKPFWTFFKVPKQDWSFWSWNASCLNVASWGLEWLAWKARCGWVSGCTRWPSSSL